MRCEIGPEKVHFGVFDYPTAPTLAVIMAFLIGSCIPALRTQRPQGPSILHAEYNPHHQTLEFKLSGGIQKQIEETAGGSQCNIQDAP